MNERCFRSLQTRRANLHLQWTERLRAVPHKSPLAHPDTLVHLMDRTIDQVFHEILHPAARRRQPGLPPGFCRCGHNPLITYFSTALLAFQAVLGQCADEVPVSRDDADDVRRALGRISRREITTFCALCQRNNQSCLAAASESAPDSSAPPAVG